MKFISDLNSYFLRLSDIMDHGSSTSIKCHVYHHVGGGQGTPVVRNEKSKPIAATIPVVR